MMKKTTKNNNFILNQWPERRSSEWTLEERAEMLADEYNAYHINGHDYWRGIKYALDCLGLKTKEEK